jgi:hypothetical protein
VAYAAAHVGNEDVIGTAIGWPAVEIAQEAVIGWPAPKNIQAEVLKYNGKAGKLPPVHLFLPKIELHGTVMGFHVTLQWRLPQKRFWKSNQGGSGNTQQRHGMEDFHFSATTPSCCPLLQSFSTGVGCGIEEK